jgi:hypothetical protein
MILSKEGVMKRIILIDFENIQKLDFDLIDTAATEILVFVGRSQNKIPFSIVEKAQTLGERIRWIKIAGDGKNNLDFHIAFELGKLAEKAGKEATLVILSKDSGYDALIGYMESTGLHIQRIANLAELADSRKQLPSSKFTDYIVANLTKIDAQKRPRTRSTLKKHAESLLRERANAAELDLVIEEMFVRGLLTQTGNRLKYALEAQEE